MHEIGELNILSSLGSFAWIKSNIQRFVFIIDKGHNLDLGHSGEGSNEYADTSGLMGYSYGQDDFPRMCFNGAQSWQLGWYSSKHVTLTAFPESVLNWSGTLVGMAEYDRTNGNEHVIVKLETGTSFDYYINFNRKTGINDETQEGGDQVLITSRGGDGLTYSNSLLVAKLGSGQSSQIIDGRAGISWTIQVTVDAIDTTLVPGVADVTISASFEPKDVHINCGGDAWVDPLTGTLWESDESYYNTGISVETSGNPPISNTDVDPLYLVERYEPSGSQMKYTIPTLNGFYNVKLMFAGTSRKSLLDLLICYSFLKSL